MQHQDIISKLAEEVRVRFDGEGSGHDWWHIFRVWQMAKRIGELEGADLFVVETGAILHDIADWKFHAGDDRVGPRVAGEMLMAYEVSPPLIEAVQTIIKEVSFKGAGVKTLPSTLEGMIVQDADRLDAMGAIGIARAFTYGGHMNRVMYDPHQKPVLHQTKEAYATSQTHTINHFYEKLLLLKERMNTRAAKTIAEDRHAFMEEYLRRFFQEWEGSLL